MLTALMTLKFESWERSEIYFRRHQISIFSLRFIQKEEKKNFTAPMQIST